MSYLDYDASGFIVGVNRMKQGIDNVHDDTQEIIQILKSQNQIGNTRMKELTRAVKANTYRASAQSNINTTRTRSATPPRDHSPTERIGGSHTGASNVTRSAAQQRTPPAPPNTTSPTPPLASDANITANSRRANSNNTGQQDQGSTGQSNRARVDAERDANGRFVSKNSKTKSSFGNLASGTGGLATNTSGIDPLVDSFNEAKSLLSPIGRAGKLLGRGTKASWSKVKSLKRREPLPQDQDRHNRENEKLLDKIWKAIKQDRGGSSGGLLGGFGAGGRNNNRRRNRRGGVRQGAKNLFKKVGGFKTLGWLAAAAGTASLAMDWDSLDHKGKSEGVGRVGGGLAGAGAGAATGAAIGSIVPVVGTVVGGLIGAGIGGWIGSDAGEALGSVASPYIESWTSAITAYNLPKKMGDTWDDGIKPFFNRMDSLAGKLNDWLEGKFRGFGDTLSGAGDFIEGAGGLILDGVGMGDKGLGSLSAKYEGKINSANPDNIGWAYGKYQFNSATGGLDRFFKDNPEYAKQFSGLTPSSGAFNKKWRQIAASDPEAFERAQDKSAANLWYAPAAKEAKSKGFKIEDRGVQEAIFSGSIQHGGINKIIRSTAKTKGFADLSAEQQLQLFYKNRRAYARKNVKPSVMKGLDKRYDAELKDVVALSRSTQKKEAAKEAVKKAITIKQPADNSKEAKGTKAAKAQPNNSALGVDLGGMVPDKVQSLNPASNTPMVFKDAASIRSGVHSSSSAGAGSVLGYGAANLPAPPMLSIPKMPRVTQRLDSGNAGKPIVVQSGNDVIGQNVSDRALAHAITGGLGQDRHWGG